MSENVYSVYEIGTGRFTGARVYTSKPGEVPMDLPAGCAVTVGEWDHTQWTFDHETGMASPVAAPPVDWRLRQGRMVEDAMAALLRAEAEQARPMREILEAMMAQAEPPAEAVERMAAVRLQIETARARRAAVMAAESAMDLDALGG